MKQLYSFVAATWVTFAACSGATPEPASPGVVSSRAITSTLVTGCEPAKSFSGFRTELFLADDSQLQELFDCRFLGLTREQQGVPPPGDCSLHDHSSRIITLPAFSDTTMQHLGHVLDAPVVDLGPLPDNADWPPATLDWVAATTAPIGTLWRLPLPYVHLLLAVPHSQSADAVGAALAAHLLEFSERLRAPNDPAVGCALLVSSLSDLAARAVHGRTQIYVLTRSDNGQNAVAVTF